MDQVYFFFAKISCPKESDVLNFHDLLKKLESKELKEHTLYNIPNNLDSAQKGHLIFLHIGGDQSNKSRYFKDNPLPNYENYENGIHAIGTIENVNKADKEVDVNIVGLNKAITKSDLYFFPQFIDNLGGSTKGAPNQAGLYELEESVGLSLIDYIKQNELLSNEITEVEVLNYQDELYKNAKLEFDKNFRNKNSTSRFFDEISQTPKSIGLRPFKHIKNLFIEWINKEENYKKSYDGLVTETILEFWNKSFFDSKLFIINNNDIEKSIEKIKKLILNSNNEEWYKYSQATSKGAPAAILGERNYIAFLRELVSNYTDVVYLPQKFQVGNFENQSKASGLIFSDQLIKRFIASLWTKPFVICSGLSGSGKTKLAQAFAMWICQDKSQYEIVPVGADWTNREPLLGYPNALDENSYVMPENGILQLILNAKNNENLPYFLILDEMNLSHVERYFADFLSTMESKEAIPIHKIESEKSDTIPQKLELPNNLFIIGTVNIDETTYMFSPKVLDRANTIEFRLTEDDLEKFIASDIPIDLEKLEQQGATMAEDFVRIAQSKTTSSLDKYKDDIVKFFGELQKSGAEFGYRTTSEIGQLISHLESLGETNDNLLDIAIMQKLLPKLHGSRTKLTKTLVTLGGFCLKDSKDIKDNYFTPYVENSKDLNGDDNIKYKLSFEKICRMYKNAVENGFASYAEA